MEDSVLDTSSPWSHAGPAFFSSLPRESRFILVRHGQSEGNARRIVQGRLDLPLDSVGRAQAAVLAPWIVGESPDLILSSPLSRAAETAGIFAAACNAAGRRSVEPRLDSVFAELDAGLFSGLTLEDARIRYPEFYEGFMRRSWDGVEGAEGSGDLYARAMRAWCLLRDEAGRGARVIVVVTHGGLIQWLVKASSGTRTWMPLVHTGNCGVFELVASPHGDGASATTVWRRMDWRSMKGGQATAPVF
jgi:broad specificity phosphatase PhoE